MVNLRILFTCIYFILDFVYDSAYIEKNPYLVYFYVTKIYPILLINFLRMLLYIYELICRSLYSFLLKVFELSCIFLHMILSGESYVKSARILTIELEFS